MKHLHSLFVVVIVSLFFLSLSVSPNMGHGMEAGFAEADITPPLGMPMSGYSARKDPSNGVWDPLFAQALVLNDGQTEVAIVTVDLIGPPPEEIQNRIRKKAQDKFGISMIVFVATHTHAGPRLSRDKPTPENPWIETLEPKILETLSEAHSSKDPVFVEVGYTSVDISYDRRLIKPDGSVEMLWSNHERRPTTPVDQTIGVLGLNTKDGKRAITLVHYACHPVIFGGKNLKYSAEYPDALRDYVEKQLGGDCMFLQGACGEINPYIANHDNDEQGYQDLREQGEIVAKEVVRITPYMKPIGDRLPIATHTYTTELKYRFDLEDEETKKYYVDRYGEEYYQKELAERSPTIEAETPIIVLGEQIAWAGFPGEFFDDFQVDLRRRSPIPNTFFLGYCNAGHSYFPTIQAAAEGGYGASWGTKAEVGAGERLVDRAIVALHEITGSLKPYPDN